MRIKTGDKNKPQTIMSNSIMEYDWGGVSLFSVASVEDDVRNIVESLLPTVNLHVSRNGHTGSDSIPSNQLNLK